MLAGGDASFRETTFDDGRGMLAFYVDESAEVIYIFNLLWVA